MFKELKGRYFQERKKNILRIRAKRLLTLSLGLFREYARMSISVQSPESSPPPENMEHLMRECNVNRNTIGNVRQNESL